MHKQGHNLGMQYNASFQKYLARGIDLSDLEAVRLILAGNSVVDWNRANFHKKEDVDRFFALHLLDLNDPFDQRRLNFLYTESIGYLETHLKLRFPDDIRNPHDIRDIFLQASKDIGFNRRRVLSCTVLKLMHVLQHLDAAELRHRLSLSEAKILEVAEQKVLAIEEQMKRAGLPITEFYGSRKTRNSLITKLLAKRDDVAATVFDKLRFRIVI